MLEIVNILSFITIIRTKTNKVLRCVLRSSVSDSDEISNQRLKNHGYWSKNVTGSKRHQVLFGFTYSAVLLCGTQEGKHIIQ